MSFLNWFYEPTNSGSTSGPGGSAAKNIARSALKDFWSEASSKYPQNMQMSFDEFYAFMAQRGDNFLIDFGNSCYMASTGFGLDASVVTKAMKELANKNQGKVFTFSDGYPGGSDFYDALLGKFNEWPVSRILSAAGNVAKDTATTITNTASVAITGYAGIATAVSMIGLFLVIMSFKKK